MADEAVPIQPDGTPKCRQFASITCCALTDLVLEQASQSPHSERFPSEQLQSLNRSDAAFADWYARRSEPICRETLSKALLTDASWRNESPEAERLWRVANLLSRLDAVTVRFDQTFEERMRQAIYELAYGLSHELNNPLANVATRAGVLLHDESAVHRRQLLETIIDNAMRGSEMIGDLMLIARPPKLNMQSVDLGQWCRQLVEHAKSWAANREINVVLINECKDREARFDPVAIKEALWCLVRNAIEASCPGGTVTLIVEASSGPQEASGRQLARSLILRVLDEGVGLSHYALDRCFDLYYSGREAGRGLGMGLAKARQIVELHGGQVTLTNRPEGGCVGSLKLEVRS